MDTLPTTATGTLSLLPETKEQVASFAAMIREEVLSGYVDPLQFYVRWKAITQMVEAVDKDPEIKAAALREAERHGAKSFDFHGAKVTIKEAGVRYDYTACQSSAWEERRRWVENHTNSLKGLEDWLKRVDPKGGVDPDTGEVVYPPARKSTTIVSIELK